MLLLIFLASKVTPKKHVLALARLRGFHQQFVDLSVTAPWLKACPKSPIYTP